MKDKPSSQSIQAASHVGITPKSPAPRSGWVGSWDRFWFSPSDTIGMHVVRVLAGLTFLAWLLPMAGHVDALYGMQGWTDRAFISEARGIPDGAPMPFNWSILYLAGNSSGMLHFLFWSAIASFALFTVGFATRITGILTWVFVVSFGSNPALHYDADILLGILAFYLMVGYGFAGFMNSKLSPLEMGIGSWDHFLFAKKLGLGSGQSKPSYAANVFARLMQIHLALIFVATGLQKLQIGDWWSGVALWYPMNPPFETSAETLRRMAGNAQMYIFLLSIIGYAVLAYQLTFPFWAWKKSARYVLLGGLALGWFGLAFIYALPFFGPFFMIAGLSFVSPAEWSQLFARVKKITSASQNGERAENKNKQTAMAI